MEVGISEPFHPASGNAQPTVHTVKAVWDTGATGSAISKKVIQDLGLSHIDEVDNHTANGTRKAKVYLVNIYLPNKVAFPALRVVDGDFHGCDVLVGMDIIGSGDLAITHKFGKTWMTFQMPPSHDTDYVVEIDIENGKKGFRKHPGKKRQSRPRKRR